MTAAVTSVPVSSTSYGKLRSKEGGQLGQAANNQDESRSRVYTNLFATLFYRVMEGPWAMRVTYSDDKGYPERGQTGQADVETKGWFTASTPASLYILGSSIRRPPQLT